MTTIGNRIHSIRKEKGYTLEAIAKLVGTSRQTIQRYENGIISNIPAEKIEALARALETTPSTLLGWNSETPPATEEDKDTNISDILEKTIGQYDYCVATEKTFQANCKIAPPDIIFVKKQETVDNGDLYFITFDGRETAARIYVYEQQKNTMLFFDDKPTLLPDRDLNRLKIKGKIVAVMRKT